jgi:hypothetical protein
VLLFILFDGPESVSIKFRKLTINSFETTKITYVATFVFRNSFFKSIDLSVYTDLML